VNTSAVFALAATLLALDPGSARACADKSNEISVVLGVAGDKVVVVRVGLHESSTSEASSAWSGTTTLHVGVRRIATVGSIDPKAKAGDEVDRMIALARVQAERLPDFVAAKRISAQDCTSNPSRTCGGVILDKAGTRLRIGAKATPFASPLPNVAADELEVTGVVRYQAGSTEVTVVNVGHGNPRFATSVRSCDHGCREITTLHHGEQADVVVVTRS